MKRTDGHPALRGPARVSPAVEGTHTPRTRPFGPEARRACAQEMRCRGHGRPSSRSVRKLQLLMVPEGAVDHRGGWVCRAYNKEYAPSPARCRAGDSRLMKTLFLHPPSFGGYDGGAGARYQMKREVRSFWYPTWLAQPAALVEDSKLIDAPPHRLSFEDIVPEVRNRDLVVMHTSTPSFKSDVKTAERIKEINPNAKVGLIGAKVAVEPEKSLIAGTAVDFVARNEFDFTCKEVAEGKDWK